MAGDSINHQRWIVVVNDTEYELNEKQAEVLKEEIDSGNRGMVAFDDFYINIPFIEEFYLGATWTEPVFKALPPSPPSIPKKLTREEERIREEKQKREAEEAEEYRKLTIERSKMVARGMSYEEIKQAENRKQLSPAEFKERKKLLLKQAESLIKNYGKT